MTSENWLELVKKQRNSGLLSAAEFAKHNNLNLSTFQYWSKKDAKLVLKTFTSINDFFDKIQVSHTDRGNEFKNKAIDD